MKKLFFLLLPMLAAAWLASLEACRKCKIEGQVLELGTEKPIPNATVVLSECDGEVLGSFNCFETARAVVGADGAFAFKEAGISLSAEATDYWPSGDDFKLVFGDCPDPTTVYLYPHATLEVTLKNESGAWLFDGPNIDGIKNFILPLGEDTTVAYQLRGNQAFNYIFTIINQEGLPPSQDDSKVIVNQNGNILPISRENSFSPFFKVLPIGHQTTKVTIIY